MNDIAESMLALDAENDVEGMIHCVQSNMHRIPDVLHGLYQLLVAGKIRPAFIIAMLLANAGTAHPLVGLALAAGGVALGNPEEEERGLAQLRAFTEVCEPEQLAVFYAAVMEPVGRHLLAPAIEPWNQAAILQILEILKAGMPGFRSILDLEAPPQPLDLDALRRRGRDNARLAEYPRPPADAPRVPRRAVVAVRALYFPHLPASRPMDLGPRVADGMTAYGWPTVFVGLEHRDIEADFRAVAEACRQHQAEVLVLDNDQMHTEWLRQAHAGLIAELRRTLPSLKIVSLLFDTWMLPREAALEIASLVDCVWEITSPSLPLWDEPVFAGKLLHMQTPHAGNTRPPGPPLGAELAFLGGVKGYNWHRAFWLAGAAHLGLPIKPQLSTHASDGLSALESYAHYMSQLAALPCSLNLSMRSDLSRIVTGRSFETILSGSLLVQETTPDMDYYFVAGEHYLPFTTMAELRSIVAFIAAEPEEAEKIRRAGNAFARERYSDDALIGYLDHMLFHRMPAEGPTPPPAALAER